MYLKRIDPDTDVAILKSGECGAFKDTLKLQVASDLPTESNLPTESDLPADSDLPTDSDPPTKSDLPARGGLDDAYEIEVENGTGYIRGLNPRSVLLGVYRFLHALGCRWFRPGLEGELIPSKDLSACFVHISDAASYRHRGVCIEGSCSFTHIRNMIDWLPKVGMNAYFMQFSTPFAFFDHWYSHRGNPYMKPQPASVDEVAAMVGTLTEEIKKRGLIYHAVGHGWTCDTIGLRGLSWDKVKYDLSDEQRELLAMVDGKREVFGDIALNTNLCYSNPKARETIVSAIVDYCRTRREVDYLHFWLADETNNHCECENCADVLPADFYVMMLNEIDRRLTAENIPTKIVFLIYYDLLWEPQTERLVNQDRFTLMFAPITRSYTTAYYNGDSDADADAVAAVTELAPYTRNKLVMLKSVSENVARLNRWQAVFSGDGFLFDYHLMWDHFYDQGGYESARILFEDMKNLDKLNMQGMVSCQVQRAFFPTGLAMNAMASALWNKSQSLDDFTDKYFDDMFGEHAHEMLEYFITLSKLFQPPYMRGEMADVCAESAKVFGDIHAVITKMSPLIIARYQEETDLCRKKTWFALTAHSNLCFFLATALSQKAGGHQADAEATWALAVDYITRLEPQTHDLLDTKYFIDVIGRVIRGERWLSGV